MSERVTRLIKVGIKGLLLWRLRGVDCLLPVYVFKTVHEVCV